MSSVTLKTETDRHRLRRAVAICLTALLTVVALVAAAPLARAATPGITIDLLHGGVVVNDGEEIPEGADLLLRMQYDAAAGIAGTEVTLSLPGNITLTGGFPTNEAIDGIVTNDDGTVTIRFKDPIPGDVTEGALAFNLKAAQVDGDENAPIEWKIGDDEGGVTITVEDRVEPPTEITDGYSKSVSPGNLNGFVQRGQGADGNYYFDGLDPDIEDAVLTYTLVINSAEARDDFAVVDTLPAGLGYVNTSFAGELTTYNPEETVAYTFAPTVSGNSFSGAVTVPENSTLKLTYEAKVTDPAALAAALQAQFDALDGEPGGYGIGLPNEATFGGEHERTATVQLRGSIPGVGIGEAFSKNGSWSHLEVIADDGALDPPAEIVYTLGANLTLWDERNPNFTLGQNVVIRDTLSDQAEWLTDDADFISATNIATDTGIALTEAATCPADVDDFADDAFVGQWCVDGQTLLINVGKNKETNASIQVKAQLNTVEGLAAAGNSTILGATRYRLPNTAEFHHSGDTPRTESHVAYPVVLPEDREGGINDSAVFRKAGPDSDVRVNPGESAEVPYQFWIDTGKEGIDPLTSRIVDEVDHDVFDLSDPAAIPVSGSYAGQPLTPDHFALSTDSDGRLVIELSSAGKQVVGERAEGEIWVIDIVLTTVPFDGKETFEIYNRATLYGSGDDADYWGDDESEATSYGDEAELRKRVYDTETGQWLAELDALIDDGEFVNDRFVYFIELIPRGNYGSDFPVQVFSRDDVLPDSVEFLGFVELDTEGVPLLDSVTTGMVDMNGNVVATYDDGVVTIQQRDGTNLNPHQGRIVTYFAVQANEASEPIVNRIVGSEAIITPYGDPSIDIEKWNDEGSAPEYDESGALTNDGYDGDVDSGRGKELTADESLQINFTISNDGREDLVDVVVSDQLTGGTGTITDLVCLFPDETTGTEWDGPFLVGTQFDCTGTLPGLKSGDTHSNTATVTGVGILTGQVVDDGDEWHGFVPAAGSLPFTGGGAAPAAIITAVLLLLTGGGALLISRRRTAV